VVAVHGTTANSVLAHAPQKRHSRSDVDVGETSSAEVSAGQTVSIWQTRSLVGVAGVDSNMVAPLHVESGRHMRSSRRVGATTSNWAGEHVV
jgi:hypothetical protein